MDIHKPKPVHSLREFATELLTIIVGILIALSLESLVELYRFHEDVEFARADFRAEIEANAARLSADIAASEKLQAALERLGDYGRSALQHKPVPAPAASLTRSFVHLPEAAWRAALSTQSLGHFPHEEERSIAEAYSEQEALTAVEQSAEQTWFALSAYDFSAVDLNDTEIREALRQLMVSYTYLLSLKQAEQHLLATYQKTLKVIPSSG